MLVLVDAHHHLWDPARGYGWLDEPGFEPLQRRFDFEDLRPELRAAGLDRTVLVEAARCTSEEVGEFLAIADATAEVCGVVGWVELADPGLEQTLAAHRKRPGGRWLVGARAQVQGEDDPAYLSRPEVRRGLEAVAQAGLVYDLVVRVDQLPACAEAARALPGLTFVLDHLGKPRIRDGALDEWRRLVAPLAECPNVACKLSGLVTEADHEEWSPDDLRPFVETAIELFGVERAVFGSDWPVCLLAASYGQVKQALEAALPPVSDAERAGIFGGNAVRLYRLEQG